MLVNSLKIQTEMRGWWDLPSRMAGPAGLAAGGSPKVAGRPSRRYKNGGPSKCGNTWATLTLTTPCRSQRLIMSLTDRAASAQEAADAYLTDAHAGAPTIGLVPRIRIFPQGSAADLIS